MTNKLLQLSHSLHEKYISWVSKTQVKTSLSNLLTRLCWNEFCVTIFINREVHHLPSILPQRLDNSGEPVTSTWLLEAILGATITPHSAKTPHWAWPAENRHIEKKRRKKKRLLQHAGVQDHRDYSHSSLKHLLYKSQTSSFPGQQMLLLQKWMRK